MYDHDPSRYAGNRLYNPLPSIDTLPEFTAFLNDGSDVSASPDHHQASILSAAQLESIRTRSAVEVYDHLYGDPSCHASAQFIEDFEWVIEAQYVGHGANRTLVP